MCEIIEVVQSNGIELEHLQQVLKIRPGEPSGKWSAQSIGLIVMGAVEQQWRAQSDSRGQLFDDR